MQAWLTGFIGQFGYLAIGVLVFLENVIPVVPSEVILTFSGFMTTTSKLTVWGVLLTALPGCIAGPLVLYALGRVMNEERMERWFGGKLGRVVHIKPTDVRRAHDWFLKKGQSSVFFCRFVPVLRCLISLPAGMTEMPLPKFLLFTLAGSVLWNAALVGLGVAAGSAWESVLKYTGVIGKVLLAAVLAALVVLVLVARKKQQKQAQSDSNDNSGS